MNCSDFDERQPHKKNTSFSELSSESLQELMSLPTNLEVISAKCTELNIKVRHPFTHQCPGGEGALTGARVPQGAVHELEA